MLRTGRRLPARRRRSSGGRGPATIRAGRPRASTTRTGGRSPSSAPGEAAAAPPPRPTVPLRAGRGLARRYPLQILLAEDHLVNQQVVIGLLEHLGYNADLVANGRDVLAALESRPYDVVLMDVQMPELDGLSATRCIRSQLPAGRQPWIIALTAHAMPGDRDRCLAAGMDGYLSKPVQIAQLEEVLAAAPRRFPAEEPDSALELPAGPLDPLGPLDRAVLDQVLGGRPGRDGGMDLLGTLAGLYAESSAADLARVRQLVPEGRWPEAARTVHSLKGSSSTLGLVRVAAVCAALEETLGAARSREAAPLVLRLEQEVERAREELARAVQQGRVRV